jgi:outer membrane protein TolC
VGPENLNTDDAEAAYVGLLPRTAPGGRRQLFAELADQGVPAFALRGRPDVEAGALAGLLPPSEQKLARRVAQHLDAVLRGTAATELPAYLPLQERLTLNGRTAAAIGFEPALETVLVAEVIHPEALELGEPLQLGDAIQLALESNIDLQLQDDELQVVRAERGRAGSVLLPQIELGSSATQIDSDRAASSGGLFAERETLIGLTATQVLFDDSALTGYRAARKSERSAEYEYQAARLDVAESAARAYLNWRRAVALASIEIANLRLTISNLETARVRLQVGAAGREEVYRWGSEEAQQRASVLAALAAVDQTRFALNQVLGVDQSNRWRSAASDPTGDLDQVDQRWHRVADVEGLPELDAAVVAAALERSPSIRSLEESIGARRAVLGQRRRSFYVPSLFAVFSFDRVLDQEFAQAPVLPGIGAVEERWTFALSASLPLFEGGDRFHALGEARAQLDLTEHSQVRAQQLIEQQARSALTAVRSSYPAIELSRSAADQSRLNLEIVRDRYAVGKASILDLLDAQRQTFSLEQTASIAVYDYLEDLTALQRSISWFELLASPDEVDHFFSRLDEGAEHEQ